MKQQHVENCNFSSWYPRFKNVTIRSKIIPLSKEFVDYLKTDGVVLPGKPSSLPRHEDDESDSEEWQNLEEDPEQATIEAPEFNDIDTKIKEAIQELGGEVFPKLNWSAPKDASWISHDNTLRCKSPGDIYLLLKSSDTIDRVLCDAFIHCEDNSTQTHDSFELILRKWQNIYPAMEFRCFVRNNELVAISQRDISNYYHFLAENEDEICADILNFYESKIEEKFPDTSYVFDVYKYADQKCTLIDFSPYGVPTNPLLFTWSELDTEVVPDLLFKVVPSAIGVQPGPFACSRLPQDMVDLTSGADVNKLVDFLNVGNLIRRPGEASDDDS
ncbi:cell division cycle protein 123 homolog [Nematostella vectensis]|uniref:cell division cycle protein 123 homolog n=1 Tax=Nematostella vectensis TaxID=45351 RepID=UPI0020775D68|nr:cell division cycle protein 123 homolog [Nematostella vectensis]